MKLAKNIETNREIVLLGLLLPAELEGECQFLVFLLHAPSPLRLRQDALLLGPSELLRLRQVQPRAHIPIVHLALPIPKLVLRLLPLGSFRLRAVKGLDLG